MANSNKNKAGVVGIVIFSILFALCLISLIASVIIANPFLIFFSGCGVIGFLVGLLKNVQNKQRRDLINEIFEFYDLNINSLYTYANRVDDYVVVKSRKALEDYSDIKYFKDGNPFEKVLKTIENKSIAIDKVKSILSEKRFAKKSQYKFVIKELNTLLKRITNDYVIRIAYITSAGNNLDQRTLCLNQGRVDEIARHPELLMSKGEYNKLLKQQSKDQLDEKKHSYYSKVNSIIEFVNETKDRLVVKSREKDLDELVQKLFDRTVNSIQKVSSIDSDEWGLLDSFINSINEQSHKIVESDTRLKEYYESDSFSKIQNTCSLLMQSQKEFNDYINEKAQSITQLFGTRIVRNETQNEDVYNYIRAYKKSITPFTAEVSSTVFGSAENNPIAYIIKNFYPNKSQYVEQIQKLRLLIQELETLKDAKVIIDNYKKDYAQYIQEVPAYVLQEDESGFYSRLGLAIIDESVLTVEYKFIYTSDGGMAQRSFTVPMNEENITELINQLESKLTASALAKEQRALMTSKLRTCIKERDDYTCCQCGNSVHSEPNLLLEIDHIIPVSKGGLTQEDNLQTLCWKCNRSKGAKIV